LLIVDDADSGRAVGVEMTAPRAVALERLSGLLAALGELPSAERDYARRERPESRHRLQEQKST
jgi:hypothetical protein